MPSAMRIDAGFPAWISRIEQTIHDDVEYASWTNASLHMVSFCWPGPWNPILSGPFRDDNAYRNAIRYEIWGRSENSSFVLDESITWRFSCACLWCASSAMRCDRERICILRATRSQAKFAFEFRSLYHSYLQSKIVQFFMVGFQAAMKGKVPCWLMSPDWFFGTDEKNE